MVNLNETELNMENPKNAAAGKILKQPWKS